MIATHCQQVSTDKDRDGNPRRLWLLYSSDGEGYAGRPAATQGLVVLPRMLTTPGNYAGIVNIAKVGGFFHPS